MCTTSNSFILRILFLCRLSSILNIDVISICDDLERSSLMNQESRGDLHQEVAISLLTAEGYDGQNCCVSIQACLALKETVCT